MKTMDNLICKIYEMFRFQIGTFYMLNLFLAVIATQFAVTKAKESHLMAVERFVLEQEKSEMKCEGATTVVVATPSQLYTFTPSFTVLHLLVTPSHFTSS